MGIILQKFKKEKTTYEILENLQDKIKEIQDFSLSTQQRQKQFIGTFLLLSIGLYVIVAMVFYFAFFPPTLRERIIYSTPMLIFPPVMIILCKGLFGSFFERKIRRNKVKLKELLNEKKKIMDQVMEKETYKVAVDLLKRFSENPGPILDAHSIVPKTLIATQVSAGSNNSSRIQPLTPVRSIHNQSITKAGLPLPSDIAGKPTSVTSPTPITSLIPRAPFQITPYPIINQSQKTVVEKLVDYLIGDGPNSRYAMICKECFEHNGMVSEEEYEYAAFKCAFCKTLNSAKKLRPVAPRISSHTPNLSQYQSSDHQYRNPGAGSDNSESSDSDDIQNIIPPSIEQSHRSSPTNPFEREFKDGKNIVQPESKSTNITEAEPSNDGPVETLPDKSDQLKKDE